MKNCKIFQETAVILSVIFLFFLLLMRTFSDRETRTAGDTETVSAEKADPTAPPQIALTFDDGPSRQHTPALLDGLKERGVPATFFLIGKNIEGNEDLVLRMQEEGHLIGNHTYNHVELDRVTAETAREEIERTGNRIYEITGEYPTYIRPPFGAWKKNLELSVSMLPVLWDIDTLDWKSRNADSIVAIVEANAADGSIILMHDGYESSVVAALRVVDLLTSQGYKFVTADTFLVT